MKQKSKYTTITVEREVQSRVSLVSKAKNISQSELITELLDYYMSNNISEVRDAVRKFAMERSDLLEALKGIKIDAEEITNSIHLAYEDEYKHLKWKINENS